MGRMARPAGAPPAAAGASRAECPLPPAIVAGAAGAVLSAACRPAVAANGPDGPDGLANILMRLQYE